MRPTPMQADTSGTPVKRVGVTFGIVSYVLTASTLARMLPIQPDSLIVMGCDRTPPKIVPKHNGWYMDQEDDTSYDVEQTVIGLLHRIEPIQATLVRLRAMDAGLETMVLVAVMSQSVEISLNFQPSPSA